MTLLRAKQFVFALSLSVLQLLGFGFAQSMRDTPAAATSMAAVPQRVDAGNPARAFPRIHLWGSEVLTYVGVFSPDATFHRTSRLTGATGYSPGEGVPPASSQNQGPRHTDAPESMLLSNERVVENLEPPAHAEAEARAPAPAAEIRNRLITYVLWSAKRSECPAACRYRLTSAPDHQRPWSRCSSRSRSHGKDFFSYRNWQGPPAAATLWRCGRR